MTEYVGRLVFCGRCHSAIFVIDDPEHQAQARETIALAARQGIRTLGVMVGENDDRPAVLLDDANAFLCPVGGCKQRNVVLDASSSLH